MKIKPTINVWNRIIDKWIKQEHLNDFFNGKRKLILD